MFSALKRLTSTKNDIPVPNQQPMSQNLQRKFARGVQYNMKIIIKGDRNTGKTCLFERLQGNKFIQEYVPTEQIQVASIQWNYESSGDVVKVEVWDVVDRARRRATIEGLKLTTEVQPALDAEFLDVYKGTHGVILVMDITKTWTFEYIKREIDNVSAHIPTVIVGNHCDMSHHRTISQESVMYMIKSVQRERPGFQIRYTEASMSNGFGLKYLHKFFGLPFLKLQRDTLIGQLQTNEKSISDTITQLEQYQRGPDSDYKMFQENLRKKRREVADSSGVSVNVSSNNRQPPIILGEGKPIQEVDSSKSSSNYTSSSNLHETMKILKGRSLDRYVNKHGCFPDLIASRQHVTKASPIPDGQNDSSDGKDIKKQPDTGSKDDKMSKQSSTITKQGSQSSHGVPAGSSEITSYKKKSSSAFPSPSKILTVEEFVPDGGHIDSSFLEDMSSFNITTPVEPSMDSDSDLETGDNPLVTGYQDDVDPEDMQMFSVPPTSLNCEQNAKFEDSQSGRKKSI